MDERTLLEMAAKAAGLIGDWSKTLGGWDCLVLPNGHVWQPLHDDGDALRLMARLRFQVDYRAGFVGVSQGGAYLGQCPHDDNDDRGSAATRLAIVRAAAAIGEKMP